MSDKQQVMQTELTSVSIEKISTIAAREAVKETVAYLTSESFKKLNEENDHRIATVIKETLHQQEKQKAELEKKRKKNMLKNTELLIINYRKCKEMVISIDLDEMEDEGTFLASEELTLEQLEKYRFKTFKMVRHIENMLAAYDNDTRNGTPEYRRRFLIMQRRYIADERMSVAEVMEFMNVSQPTVYKDTKKAMHDMASFIFGYDAVMFN